MFSFFCFCFPGQCRAELAKTLRRCCYCNTAATCGGCICPCLVPSPQAPARSTTCPAHSLSHHIYAKRRRGQIRKIHATATDHLLVRSLHASLAFPCFHSLYFLSLSLHHSFAQNSSLFWQSFCIITGAITPCYHQFCHHPIVHTLIILWHILAYFFQADIHVSAFHSLPTSLPAPLTSQPRLLTLPLRKERKEEEKRPSVAPGKEQAQSPCQRERWEEPRHPR